MKYATYLILAIFLITVAACGSDDEASSCSTDNVTYNNTVKAIFDANGCTNDACHGPARSAANFSVASYQDYQNFVRKAKLVDALKWQNGAQEMPRDSATQMGREMLPDCDIKKIEAWVAAGEPE